MMTFDLPLVWRSWRGSFEPKSIHKATEQVPALLTALKQLPSLTEGAELVEGAAVKVSVQNKNYHVYCFIGGRFVAIRQPMVLPPERACCFPRGGRLSEQLSAFINLQCQRQRMSYQKALEDLDKLAPLGTSITIEIKRRPNEVPLMDASDQPFCF